MEIRGIDSITTTELIDELAKRCQVMCFIGYKDEGSVLTFYRYSGNAATCFGLCHELAFNIQRDINIGAEDD